MKHRLCVGHCGPSDYLSHQQDGLAALSEEKATTHSNLHTHIHVSGCYQLPDNTKEQEHKDRRA